MDLEVLDSCRETTTTTGTGTISLDGAVTGFQAFATTGARYQFRIEDAAGNWEVAEGVYTSSGRTLSRDVILSSSNSGSAVSWAAGTKYVQCIAPAGLVKELLRFATQVPGGRISASSTDSVTTTDQLAVSTLYYVPHVHDIIQIYSRGRLRPFNISDMDPLDISGATSGNGYDIFCRDVSGVAEMDYLAWTNATTRATSLAWINGIRCKSGDPTRRYVGSFYPNASGQTESSFENRYIWNVDNQVPLILTHDDSANQHTYNTGSFREWNGGTHRVRWFSGLPMVVNLKIHSRCSSGYGSGSRGLSIDSVGAPIQPFATSITGGSSETGDFWSSIGPHYAAAVEYNTGTSDELFIGGHLPG